MLLQFKMIAIAMLIAHGVSELPELKTKNSTNYEYLNSVSGVPRVLNYEEVVKRIKYPVSGWIEGVEGDVKLKILVCPWETVRNIRIISIPHPDLAEACIEALRNLQFVPAVNQSGYPIEMWVGLPVKFMIRI